MGAVVDVKDPLKVRKASLQVITENLGPEVMLAFMRQSVYRSGDMVAEKYAEPEQSMEEIAEELRRVTVEERARRQYDN